MQTPHIDVSSRPVTTHGISSPPKHSWKILIQEVADIHGVTPREMMARDKHRRLVRARWHLMSILHDRGWSYPTIGRAFGLDHTTCVHGVRQHKRLCGS